MKTVAKVHHQQIKNDSYREALTQWFSERRWSRVYPILSNQDQDAISLRVLEFLTDPDFVEQCKQAGVPLSYYIDSPTSGRRLFNLPANLAAMQTIRRKKFCEPFARHNKDLDNGGRFEFGYENQKVETNVAQLQFMRFLVENNVLDWCRKHKDFILQTKSRFEHERMQQRRRGDERPRKLRRRMLGIDSRAVTGVTIAV